MTLDTDGNNVSQAESLAKRLLSVEEARAVMLAAVSRLKSEKVPLNEALGRVLAEAVNATRDQPPFNASAMDGYALRSSDTPGRLRLAGEAAAGHGFAGRCETGMAIRVSTGAAVPDGADTVAMQEDVQREGDHVDVPAMPAGQHLRLRGGDFTAGSPLLAAGRRLDGVGLSMVAAAGLAEISAARRPHVAILSSGDELVAPGTKAGPWQIFDSTTYGIAAWIQTWGGVAQRMGVEKDDAPAIGLAAKQALGTSDLLLVVGGASVGDHDLARPALQRLGLELLVGKVAVRPGKPTWFGRTPQGLVLGLPGNPASALVCTRLFLRPILEKMLGVALQDGTSTRRARLTTPLSANGPREHYLRARAQVDQEGRLCAQAFVDQDSSLISVFASANALIRLPAGAPAMAAGEAADVLLLDGL
jgi:molybdopterin molybdotransferase